MFASRTWCFLPILLTCAGAFCFGQDNDSSKSDKSTPVPVLSGSFGFDGQNTGGAPALEPFIEPVLLVPISDKFLIEARGELVGVYTRQNGSSGPYDGTFFKNLGYLQADYIANPHVTITAGKFLIPFGIYAERQSPFWVKVFQDDPLTLPIGSPTGAGNGVMLRGVAASNSSVAWNYVAYYTAATTVDQFQSPGTIGFRTGFFVPRQRFEAGVSYQRVLQNYSAVKDSNPFGFYLSWQPNETSLDIKGQYDHSPRGAGYWLQAALQLDKAPAWRNVLKRAQIAGRIQQSFSVSGVNALTGRDQNQVDVALNYVVFENARLFSSYGRAFNSLGNFNLWNAGFSYRFTFPAWPGGSK